MKWAQITDKGLSREENEDSLLIAPDLGLLAVADGMGGHRGGRIASSLALDTLAQELARLLGQGGDLRKSLLDAVKMANSAIFARSKENAALEGMGTTVTACLARDNRLFTAHIGDSRAYLLRREELRQLTWDHSLVQEMARRGGLSEEQARSHPQRHLLTRALGAEPFVEVDVTQDQLLPQDRLLLCTDGLTRYLGQTELLAALQTGADLEETVLALLGNALNAGGADNVTIILACF